MRSPHRPLSPEEDVLGEPDDDDDEVDDFLPADLWYLTRSNEPASVRRSRHV